MNPKYDPGKIEKKWQSIWESEKTFQPEPDERQKFFITVPYPYLNGNLHAGHTRTFTIGDVVARYRRMLGFNVLFPMGSHVTGTPIVGLAELIQKKDPETIRVYTTFHDIPLDVLVTLNTPEKIVAYFSREAESAMRSIGFSIDWRRKFTTTDPGYKMFVTWQFNLLREMGHVVRGSHPVRWCPNDKNPVEDHDILRGEDATIIDYTLIKFKLEGGSDVLPCATLRPETVFGVTNLWVNPDVIYLRVGVNGEKWIVSREAYEKLRFTDRKIELIEEVKGSGLIGSKVHNPVTKTSVLILPASFVSPDNGSGIVMSVPAHAPYDYLALRDLKGADLRKYGITEDVSEIPLIPLIKVPEYGTYPAVDAVRELKVKDQNDPKAEEATKLVYRREFHNGILTETTGKYAGMAVSKIKDVLTKDLISGGCADVFYEFSEQPVICRCGATCVVKLVENQWFLNYSDPEWKEKVYKCLQKMEIIPEDIRIDFENKIEWLKDKACARRKGLGTHLPWDKEWLIESLGDSTIYMSYYILAKFLENSKKNGIRPEQLKPQFFDYVFLGKGSAGEVSKTTGIDQDLITGVRSDFEYWYPVNLRSSGKDLIPNHLLFFLYHHVAIFPEEKWPRAIAINGFVSLEGQKMSKSRGPLLTLRRAVSEYGADITRFYILSTAEHIQDADWRNADIDSAKKQIEKFYRMAYDALSAPENPVNDDNDLIDRWLMSRLQMRIIETRGALDKVQTRRAIQNAFYLVMNDLKWYEKRGGSAGLAKMFNVWVRLMAPFTPHLCEEIWAQMGNSDLSTAPFPEADLSLIDRKAELSEEIIRNTLGDIEEILRLTGIKPKKVILYTTPAWKAAIFKQSLALKKENRLEMKVLMGESMKDAALRPYAKDIPKYAQKLIEDVKKMDSNLLATIIETEIDDLIALGNAGKFLERETGCGVEIYSADDKAAYDPQGKKKFASPMKPAIYIES